MTKRYRKVSRDPNQPGAGKSGSRALKTLKKSDPITYKQLSVNAAQEHTKGIDYDDGGDTYQLFTKAFDYRDQQRETRIRHLTTAYAALQRRNSLPKLQDLSKRMEKTIEHWQRDFQ